MDGKAGQFGRLPVGLIMPTQRLQIPAQPRGKDELQPQRLRGLLHLGIAKTGVGPHQSEAHVRRQRRHRRTQELRRGIHTEHIAGT